MSCTGTIGKIRWPNAPAICGRISVATATQAGGNVDVTLAEAASQLKTGHHVDFTGVGGLGSDLTVTVTDSTHFSVAGTLSGAYTGGGYVNSTGAAAYQWHDDQPKGDYLYLAWAFNYRDYQERDRIIAQHETTCGHCTGDPGTAYRTAQGPRGMPRAVNGMTIGQTDPCMAFDPCNPQVLCISPNGETWAKGTTKAFPSFALDERYGARWQAEFVQHLQDPLWQPQAKECVAGGVGDPPLVPDPCSLVEDSGECAADLCVEGVGTKYFAHRPVEEARSDPPVGAPALPERTTMHVLTLAELQGSPPDGLVLAPGDGPGYAEPGADNVLTPNPHSTPWGLFLREACCVCGNCATQRFSPEYTANGIKVRCPA